MSPAVAEKDVHLFPAQDAIRYRLSGSFEELPRTSAGQNPPAGAVLHYFLKKKPAGEITLEILDAKGALVEKLSSKEEKEEQGGEEGDYGAEGPKKVALPLEPGLHRVVWDLHYPGATVIKGAKADTGDARNGPLANPGDYTVKLTVEGKSLATPLKVLLDPRQLPQKDSVAGASSPTVLAELAEQLPFSLQIRDDITKLSKTVEQLRSVRKQLKDRDELLKDDPKAAELVKKSKELLPKLDELEEKLHNPKAKVAYDILAQKGGAKLYSQLVWLFELVKDSDGAPTQGVKEVYQEQSLLLKKYELEWQLLIADDLVKLNDLAKKLDLPGVIVPVQAEKTVAK
jgi:hypothetical protein